MFIVSDDGELVVETEEIVADVEPTLRCSVCVWTNHDGAVTPAEARRVESESNPNMFVGIAVKEMKTAVCVTSDDELSSVIFVMLTSVVDKLRTLARSVWTACSS